jgi:putative ABC transport system substrate-binding protein
MAPQVEFEEFPELNEVETAASTLGVRCDLIPIRVPEDFESGFATAARESADGVVITAGPQAVASSTRLAELALATRMPTIAPYTRFVEAGGLMAYGPNTLDLWRRSAAYVVKLLQGANPAELPVEQPMRFDFIINARTAQTLGLAIPHYVLLQASELIQ